MVQKLLGIAITTYNYVAMYFFLFIVRVKQYCKNAKVFKVQKKTNIEQVAKLMHKIIISLSL